MSSALTFRSLDVVLTPGRDAARGAARCWGGRPARDIGVTAGRGCSWGGGERCGLGGATGGESSDLDDSLSADFCSLLQPLARETITNTMTQISGPMSESFIILTSRAGFTDVFSRDGLAHVRIRLNVLHPVIIQPG